MTDGPDRSERPEQETGVSEASAERRAPQASQERRAGSDSPALQEQSPEAGRSKGDKPSTPQEFYWRRQAEKLETELAAARAEGEAELNRLSREKEEAASRATEAEWRAKRLSLIAEAGLPSELVELVPEGEPERVAEYVERLKLIAEKLARPRPRGLTNTNPPNAAGGDEARLERLRAQAARGDRRALREYSHLRDRIKRIT
jgi:hypothetical protein